MKIQSFGQKFGTKNTLYEYFRVATLKTIVILEIITLNHHQIFVRRLKALNLGPRMTYLGVF